MITAAMRRLSTAVADASAWAADDRQAVLRGLDRVIDGLSVVRGVVLVAERDSGAWRGAGDRSFAAARARACGAAPGTAGGAGASG